MPSLFRGTYASEELKRLLFGRVNRVWRLKVFLPCCQKDYQVPSQQYRASRRRSRPLVCRGSHQHYRPGRTKVHRTLLTWLQAVPLVNDAPSRQGASRGVLTGTFSSPLAFVSRLLVGGVFVIAGMCKLFQGYPASASLLLARLLPGKVIMPMLIIWPLVELLLGILLLLGVAQRWVSAVAAGLLILFLWTMLAFLSGGVTLRCSCGGPHSLKEYSARQ